MVRGEQRVCHRIAEQRRGHDGVDDVVRVTPERSTVSETCLGHFDLRSRYGDRDVGLFLAE